MPRNISCLGLVFTTAVILIAGGCQSNYRAYSESLTTELKAGRFEAASRLAVQKADSSDSLNETDPTEETVVYLLEAGRCTQIAGDDASSVAHFQHAEALMYRFYAEETEASASEAVATTLVNQATSDYLGTPSDRIMCSTLLAIQQLAAGDPQNASISFQRAQNWQQNLRMRFESEIAAKDKALRDEGDSEKGGPSASAVDSASSSVLKDHYAGLDSYLGYADFGNPFFHHAYAVFQLTNPRFASSGASFDFRQVAKLNPGIRDMINADLAGGRRLPSSGTTWVYFMSGLAPSFKELRLDIPIPVGDVNFVSAAFPIMQFDESFDSGLTVRTGETSVTTALLSDMASIRAAEFKARLPQIIFQEILSSAIKAGATYAAGQIGGGWAQIGGILYQAATTSADTRCWHSVPARIELARIPTPVTGTIEFSLGRDFGSAKVDPGSNNLILVNLPGSLTPSPTIQVIPLGPDPTSG